MEFHNKLMELRKEKGWSQEELGNRINVSRQTVSKWELGQTTPEMNKLIEISRLFQITVDELIGADSYYEPKMDEHGRETYQTVEQKTKKPHYEYISEKKIKGRPLVHVNIGVGRYKAKGIIAIGNTATGIVAVGMAAKGLFTVGLASLGLLSIGLCTVGLLALGQLSVGIVAMGGVAVGALAFGGIAVGVVTFGGLSVGVYSVGGMAIASRVAAGGSANAPIAIGDTVQGAVTFLNSDAITKEELRAAILSRYPGTWEIIIKLILLFAVS
ncbi:MAG: helix-turn-helix domain-containing protein [Roseburia sp.]|nr:helix-turn-helix domain-containing protein [Roseburia sp.]MCM1279976.1 helix-turn-helix domain-containing protein [Robinsoniella sp.]